MATEEGLADMQFIAEVLGIPWDQILRMNHAQLVKVLIMFAEIVQRCDIFGETPHNRALFLRCAHVGTDSPHEPL
jgi:hypothetical protein